MQACTSCISGRRAQVKVSHAPVGGGHRSRFLMHQWEEGTGQGFLCTSGRRAQVKVSYAPVGEGHRSRFHVYQWRKAQQVMVSHAPMGGGHRSRFLMHQWEKGTGQGFMCINGGRHNRSWFLSKPPPYGGDSKSEEQVKGFTELR